MSVIRSYSQLEKITYSSFKKEGANMTNINDYIMATAGIAYFVAAGFMLINEFAKIIL